MQVLNTIVNNPLYVSILVILISSLVGFYVQARGRDRCLRDFDSFRVTIETKAGKVAWGTMRAYSSGIELLYKTEHKDIQGHVENSYILYGNELGTVQAIYRLHDDQSEQDQHKREKDIRRTYRPSLFQRIARGVRNVISTFKDAIVQTVNTILGYRAAQSPQNLMLSKHKELADSGAQLLGVAIGNAYEPILERYIGQYVVLEIVRGDQIEEEYGILKEYSAKYIELLNVKIQVPLLTYLKEDGPTQSRYVQVEHQEQVIHVTNQLHRTIEVEAIHCGEKTRPVEVLVEQGQSVQIERAENEIKSETKLDINVRCLADLIVPRGMATVRHGGKREKLSLDALFGLDELSYLPWVKRLLGDRETTKLNRGWLKGNRSRTR